jgi:hypothetical protein
VPLQQTSFNGLLLLHIIEEVESKTGSLNLKVNMLMQDESGSLCFITTYVLMYQPESQSCASQLMTDVVFSVNGLYRKDKTATSKASFHFGLGSIVTLAKPSLAQEFRDLTGSCFVDPSPKDSVTPTPFSGTWTVKTTGKYHKPSASASCSMSNNTNHHQTINVASMRAVDIADLLGKDPNDIEHLVFNLQPLELTLTDPLAIYEKDLGCLRLVHPDDKDEVMALNNTVAAATPAVLDPVQPVPVSSTEVIVIGQSPTKIHQLEPQEEVVILGPAPHHSLTTARMYHNSTSSPPSEES